MHKYIKIDQLPEKYGGLKSDYDFSKHIKPGGTVPPKYYIDTNEMSQTETKSVSVGKITQQDVESLGTTLEKEFPKSDCAVTVAMNYKVKKEAKKTTMINKYASAK